MDYEAQNSTRLLGFTWSVSRWSSLWILGDCKELKLLNMFYTEEDSDDRLFSGTSCIIGLLCLAAVSKRVYKDVAINKAIMLLTGVGQKGVDEKRGVEAELPLYRVVNKEVGVERSCRKLSPPSELSGARCIALVSCI
jgi:hypothetical protein